MSALALQVAAGIGLASCARLRAFLPLFVVGAAGRAGWVDLARGFEWLASTPALVVLGSAVVAEILADKLPAVDHLLDSAGLVVRPAAGALAMASTLSETGPLAAAVLPAAVLEGGAGTSILAADLDGDGRADLATVDPGANEVTFRAGRGDAAFGAPRGFRAGSSPACPAAADLDGDGAPDLAIPSNLTDEAWILRNRGGGPVRPPQARTPGNARFECTSPAGAAVLLDGTASSDPDSTPGTRDDIVSCHSYEETPPAGRFLGAGERLEVGLPLGAHPIVLRVADSDGEIDTDEAAVGVTDTTPPDFAIALSPPLLWPPDQRLVEVAAAMEVPRDPS